MKPSSESTPLRIVTNASFHHLSKSLNDNVVSGLTELPPILDLLLDFFICPYVSLFDIKKCYRSIFTSDQTNNLCLIPLWKNKSDTECRAILKYQRMCFGDVCASTFCVTDSYIPSRSKCFIDFVCR